MPKPHVKKPFPGPKAKPVIAMDSKYMATSTKTAPIVVKSAKGVYIEDVDGNTFLDFTSGVGVLNVGSAHPKVVAAIKEQSEKFLHFAGTDYYYDIQARLAKRIAEIAPGAFPKKVFLTNSGTESTEANLKLAMWHTQKKRFIAFVGAFHGRTVGAMSLSSSKKNHRNRYFPMMPGVTHVPYANCYRCAYSMEYPSCGLHCAKIIEEVYLEAVSPAEETAAVFVEPVQGEGGYITPPNAFLQELSKICKRNEILFVDDEVQAGIGRTGDWFAIEHSHVVPDAIGCAKGIGSGLPIGATVFNAKYDWAIQGAHSNTYGGNPVCCAAALAGLDVIEGEKLLPRTRKLGEKMSRRLAEIMSDHELVGDVRGRGLMQAAEFVTDRETKKHAVKERDLIEEECWKAGLIVLGCGKSAIRFIPPLIIGEEDLMAGLDILDGAIGKVEKDL